MDFHPACIQIGHVLILAPTVLAQVHHIAHILRRRDDGGLDIGFFPQLNLGRTWKIGRVVDQDHFAVSPGDAVDHIGRCGDEVQVELPFQPLLDDLHV